ncbi:hypothetical protein VARIO8X_60401 [Burkholderiales bacterium 8X]|nr:hypothetical protein VARIO8X_60401 [Burkholderiales bacterium 8X]
MARLPAALGHPAEPRRGGRLLHLVVADRRGRHAALGHQPAGHHHQDARARHDAHEDAGLHLDVALHQRAHRRRLSGADRGAGAAVARSIRRHELLHERLRRQRHDVRQPDLDLGPPRGVHPDPAALRRVLRGGLDLQRQAPLRLCIDGLRHRGHHDPVVPGLAAPLLHDGVGRERELVLRHHHHDHLDPDRGEDLQLALHDVPRPDPLRGADAVDRRLHGHLRGGRHDRRLARGAAGRLRTAQQPLPDRALPQRDHWRRALRAVRRHQLLVPEGLRLQAGCVLGQVVVLAVAGRLLGRLRAALRAGPDGRHPAPEPLRGSFDPDLVPDRRLRRLPDRLRHRGLPDPAVRELPPARIAARPDRRPVERPHPRMVDLVAAAGLQLRLHPGDPRQRCLVRHEGPQLQAAVRRFPADPHAEEHLGRHRAGGPERRARLHPDLADVASGRADLRGADRRGDLPHLQLPARLPHRRAGRDPHRDRTHPPARSPCLTPP